MAWRRILPVLVGALVLLPMGLHAIWGVTGSAVLTDSMRPTISAGDLIVTRPVPATDLEVGHVAVLRVQDGLRAHRILDVVRGEVTVTLTTKGDANRLGDPPVEVPRSARVPLMLWHVPGAGHVAHFFTRPAVFTAGLALLLAANALAIAIVLFPRPRRERA